MNMTTWQRSSNGTSPVALFDASHGQPNWAQTGFPSRELQTNFAGLTEILCRRGFLCRRTDREPLPSQLEHSSLLIIPPPTGCYDARKERWRRVRSNLFTAEDIKAVLGFLHRGGRLLAFAYRFGDAFTQSNLGELTLALGCRLNNDAVIDVRSLRETNPLQLHFDVPAGSLPLVRFRAGVMQVRCRPCATFSLLSGAAARPLALSTGGGCISYDQTRRWLSFESLPIAVIGRHGAGRFVLFGGPHVFESGARGLLPHGDNARFLQNILDWLASEHSDQGLWPCPATTDAAGSDCAREFGHMEAVGEGERAVAAVERVLRKTGVLKALNRAKWAT